MEEQEKVDLKRTQGFLVVMSSILAEMVTVMNGLVDVNVLGVVKETVLVQEVLVGQVGEPGVEAEKGEEVGVVKEEDVHVAVAEVERGEEAETGKRNFQKVKKKSGLKIVNVAAADPVNAGGVDQENAKAEVVGEAAAENADVPANVAELERNLNQMLGMFPHLQFPTMMMRLLCLEKSNRNL